MQLTQPQKHPVIHSMLPITSTTLSMPNTFSFQTSSQSLALTQPKLETKASPSFVPNTFFVNQI